MRVSDETLREVVIAKHGTLARWGESLGVTPYKARQWASNRDHTLKPADDARIASSLDMSEIEFAQRFRQAWNFPGSHVFTLTSRQIAVLLNIATNVGAADTYASQSDMATMRLVGEQMREAVANGEPREEQSE
jgi:hypothetical protein